MRNSFVLLVALAIGCSSGDSQTTTTGRPTGSGGSGTGGASGGAGGASGGAGGSSATGGSGGSTGGAGGASGGAGGSTGGTGGSTGGAAGSTGGAAGASGGTGGTGGTAGNVDAGRDASGGSAGSADASRSDATADEVQSCTNFADAFCNRLQSCSSFVMSVLYGDVATCKQRWVLSCVPNFNVRGTSTSPARTNACAQALPNLACDKFLLGDFGATMCTPAPGMLADGAACGDDAQCTSTFCARSPTSVCGTCAPVTNPGSPCVQSSCSASTNTVCPAGATTCVKPKAGMVGEACVGQEECDVGHQVGCNTATSKQCIALTLTPSGGMCGANSILNPTSVAVCPAAGTCTLPIAGMCTPFAPDGQTCSTTDTGAHCMQPAKCVGGRCVVPDPATCN